ncbi:MULTISPECIES: enoyl-CoA hydratase/isomerase family protein [unclassified Rhodococcus (in: high G+C Gram-positive bacteria)]|uniref:enoyl-CoA hydratase/isomerase family protein n=1 Tax=unclassified Rhodococcus (in: high G+C Gram-positive bacteria) TaxID=192944 RepID=UPI0006F2457C|nr:MULTISPECIES: enoyl-CoA hydratase/isomerase family protein [unclassified Rhodococcus (in: high G+C Gram-positive bacteria)]KQU28487.1 2-ketocyclohexanecarboxyl-CoA hydrolase [Rhodococcus sp. Leaf225]KQU47632.1 2-ketocyclohexanecarboxyl-CoA hydrolase [Rhodococcus sp. Leaf258]
MTDIVVSIEDEIGIVRLNRPDRGNSVTPDVVRRMGEAVAEFAETDTVSAVVLTGTGTVFCAGADVREMNDVYTAEGPDALMSYLGDIWMPAVQATVRMLWNAPVPLVAAYNGAATAGGLDFGLACDVRIASSRARFAESYVNLGMVPVAGGAYLLPSLIGSAAALRMLATGEFISAERALALGMVSDVCEPEAVAERAVELAREMTHGPSATYASVKKIARTTATSELDAALRASLAANIELIARPGVRAGIVAVMDRYSGGSKS